MNYTKKIKKSAAKLLVFTMILAAFPNCCDIIQAAVLHTFGAAEFTSENSVSTNAYFMDIFEVNGKVYATDKGGNLFHATNNDLSRWELVAFSQTVRGNTYGTNYNAVSLSYGNGVYLATLPGYELARSTDGDNWSSVTRNAYSGNVFGSLLFDDGQFILTGSYPDSVSGFMYYKEFSTDGLKWYNMQDATRALGLDANSIIATPGGYVGAKVESRSPFVVDAYKLDAPNGIADLKVNQLDNWAETVPSTPTSLSSPGAAISPLSISGPYINTSGSSLTYISVSGASLDVSNYNSSGSKPGLSAAAPLQAGAAPELFPGQFILDYGYGYNSMGVITEAYDDVTGYYSCNVYTTSNYIDWDERISGVDYGTAVNEFNSCLAGNPFPNVVYPWKDLSYSDRYNAADAFKTQTDSAVNALLQAKGCPPGTWLNRNIIDQKQYTDSGNWYVLENVSYYLDGNFYTDNIVHKSIDNGLTWTTELTDLTYRGQDLSGYSVSGVIQSYNPQNSTLLQLLENGTVKYSIFIPSENGTGQTKQPFSFGRVAPGNYTLVVSKTNHTDYTVNNIAVFDKDVDLTQDSRAGAKLISLLVGDINGDGVINVNDLNILWSGLNYGKTTLTAQNPMCDLDGDGDINVNDLNTLWSSINYGKGAVVVN